MSGSFVCFSSVLTLQIKSRSINKFPENVSLLIFSIIECPQPETCFEPFLENGSVDGEGGDHLWTGTFRCNPGEKSRCNPGEKSRCNPGEPFTFVF